MLLLPSWNPRYRMDREGSGGGGVQERQQRAQDLEVVNPNNLTTIWMRYYAKTWCCVRSIRKIHHYRKVSRKDGTAQGSPRIFLLRHIYITESSHPQEGSIMRLEFINTRSQNRDETILGSWLQPKGWAKATLC